MKTVKSLEIAEILIILSKMLKEVDFCDLVFHEDQNKLSIVPVKQEEIKKRSEERIKPQEQKPLPPPDTLERDDLTSVC